MFGNLRFLPYFAVRDVGGDLAVLSLAVSILLTANLFITIFND